MVSLGVGDGFEVFDVDLAQAFDFAEGQTLQRAHVGVIRAGRIEINQGVAAVAHVCGRSRRADRLARCSQRRCA